MAYDYLVIGGGIVGVATAWQLQQRYPKQKVVLLDKEQGVAQHQTGHNSGVIHAGVYYAPGSLKAQLCREGNQATIAFCRKHKIPYQQCGKLLVATNEQEHARLGDLIQRCEQNGIRANPLTTSQLKTLEPNIVGLSALQVLDTGIVDYRLVTQKLLDQFQRAGGEVRLRHEVTAIAEQSSHISVAVKTPVGTETLSAGFMVSCAGLQADRIAKMLGLELDFQIIPFRGEYYRLAPAHNQLIKHLIYPIPDPALPFLGIHLTRMIDGSVTVGPNAVQGWKREGYGEWNFAWQDVQEMLTFAGFWRVSAQHWRTGLHELKNAWWKRGYLKAVRKYCPPLTLNDLQPYPAGIRAQAVLHDGSLVHDFLFKQTVRSLLVCNAPSPAATSAMPIGAYIVDKLAQIAG